ncbi:exodeoxyribonuclease VII small subunit [Sediminicurvatus halobius]|uniref:Exodeoxyribonuclease 7 small subunit n=1 Tax=Sediminicurvatus halobius TaxID=2182432 RepID=A0A2U2N7J5_9GAMM|nr:exodeoxyribonuclease VII small subunit [Spiribacter halobius]PWG65090.1 exodeoxyribonuclease VII small subunit [Spiribacter halobius]UEX78961.1 exodeoxyribonuclease VII small subunit [Spiribacter halobius]
MAEDNPFDFEASLKELEALVERMERGDLTLEESLQSFERGIRLTRECQRALREAEQKVEVLIGSGEEARAEPFEGDTGPGAGDDA